MNRIFNLGEMLPFSYVVNSTQMTANGTDAQTLVFGTDSTFLLMEFAAVTSADAVTDQTPPNNFTVSIRDTTTGRDLMNGPTRRALFAGQMTKFATKEGVIIEVPRNEQWQFDFVNLTGSTLSVYIALKGYKRFGNMPANF